MRGWEGEDEEHKITWLEDGNAFVALCVRDAHGGIDV
jgi:hypothetical protein